MKKFLRPFSPIRLRHLAQLFLREAKKQPENPAWREHMERRAREAQELATQAVKEPVNVTNFSTVRVLDTKGMTMQAIRILGGIEEPTMTDVAVEEITDVPTQVIARVKDTDPLPKMSCRIIGEVKAMQQPVQKSRYVATVSDLIDGPLSRIFHEASERHRVRYGNMPTRITCSTWIASMAVESQGCESYAPYLVVDTTFKDNDLECES